MQKRGKGSCYGSSGEVGGASGESSPMKTIKTPSAKYFQEKNVGKDESYSDWIWHSVLRQTIL